MGEAAAEAGWGGWAGQEGALGLSQQLWTSDEHLYSGKLSLLPRSFVCDAP